MNSNTSPTQEAASQLMAAGGAMLARWLEGLTVEQVKKFDTLLAAGGKPGVDVLLAPEGPVVSLYMQDPHGTRHPLAQAEVTAAPPMH